MYDVVILGAGKIGRLVTRLLDGTGEYRLRVGDAHAGNLETVGRTLRHGSTQRVDFDANSELDAILHGARAVLSCAPFRHNKRIAERAKAHGAHYLDLTEDVAVTHHVKALAKDAKTAFIPQCGLAPGFISIAGMHLVRGMSEIQELNLRVGALPRFPTNALRYNLTWSTDGLVNEYCNPCEALIDGRKVEVPPLEQVEQLSIDGVPYEAFNTSGGLGTLAETLAGKARHVNYKTIRYPGHRDLVKFLLHDLRFREHREELVRILDRALPTTTDDVVVIFAYAKGTENGRYVEKTYAHRVQHREMHGELWSAIQVTTAGGICAVADLLLQGRLPQQGFVRQEDVRHEEFLANRFGRCFA